MHRTIFLTAFFLFGLLSLRSGPVSADSRIILAALTADARRTTSSAGVEESSGTAALPADARKSPSYASTGTSETLQIVKISLCRDVQQREPMDPITSTRVGDSVVGWTQVQTGVEEITIMHRWLHEDQPMAEVPLNIHGSAYRTWSRKTISEPGHWKWQVVDSGGHVVKEVAFNAE